jgi:TonB family protein
VTAVLTVARVAPATIPRTAHPLMFVSVVPAPDPATIVPIKPLAMPRPPAPKAPEVVVEAPPPPVKPITEPRRVPEVVLARATPAVPPPAPKRVEPLAEFTRPDPVGHAIEPPKAVQAAGFDAPAARSAMPEIKTAGKASVGGFESSAAARPQPGSDRPNVVAEAGFGATMASASARQTPRPIGDAGFGDKVEAQKAPQTPRNIKSTDFDAQAPAPAAPQAAPRPQRVDIPVEILSKPTPVYTDEARALKIEGDVVLEVEFTAAGDIRVLRVVRGLGHRLDEAASRAALGIKFKAAQSAGRPIDFRTTVHIVFRLA